METYKLSDLCEILDSKRKPLSALQRAKKQGIYPYYGAQGIIDHLDEYLLDGEYLLVAEDGANLETRNQPIANIANGKIWVNNHAHVLGNNGKCPLNLLGFILNNMNISPYVTGCAQPKLNQENLRNIEIELPSHIDRIASILSSLDRKIELNNKINADLEEMAQAIFKNWFVDFEPFKDGKFVDSELGMIPEGWKVVTLDDLTSKFGTGLNPRKNFVLGHGNNYYVTIKNMGNNRIYLNDRCDKVDDEALAKINKRSKLQKGDLLFSGIGTIGRVAMIVDDPINWNTSESVFNMHPIDTVSSEFIYLLLLSDKFQQYVQQNAQGGVQQGIRMASLKAFQFAIPDDLNLFDNLVKPIISKVKSNDKENDTLSLLRDTLLPRLMSGEIEIPE